MKMNLIKGYLIAYIYNEQQKKTLWAASLMHHGKYPAILYEDPYRILLVKYKNILEAGEDYAKRARILGKMHKIQTTEEGTKFICEYYRTKFG